MRVLVVSPHPDDETLGAGGTLLKLKKQGHQVYWMNVTDMSTEYGWDVDLVKRRQEQIEEVKNFYGFDDFYNLSLPPMKLKGLDEGEVISRVKKIYDIVMPDWLIIPGRYDAHSDHRVTYDCCMVAAKAFRSPYIKRIMTMEIISETDGGFQKEKFEPNLFVDISNEIDDKIKAVQIYDTELEDEPFPRNIRNIRSLAEIRGATSNCIYAEGFCVVRVIE